MDEGKSRNDWNHTAAILATIINTQANPPKTFVSPNDLHPMKEKKPLQKISAEKIAEFFETN